MYKMSKKKSRRSCEICGVKEAHLETPLFFANFPLDENRCKKWVQVTGKTDLVHLPIEKLNTIKHVCVKHFKSKDMNKNGNRLKKRAVPSLNLMMSPLSDAQMSEFPLHVYNSSAPVFLPENILPSTSREGQGLEATRYSGNEAGPSVSTVFLPENILPSTSREGQGLEATRYSVNEAGPSVSTVFLPENILPSTSREGQGLEATRYSGNEAGPSVSTVFLPENILPSTSRVGQGLEATRYSGNEAGTSVSTELTPRKKKLVERLRKTKCTIKSLKKSAILIDKIQSPVLKELVINSCKNEKIQPKGRRWTTKHKLSCLAILKRSPKTYRYLSAVVTLPSIKTLQNVLKKVPMTPGISQSVLNHLKVIADCKDPKDRICSLAFDEMALKSRLVYNEGSDIVEGFEDLGDSGRSSELADHALVFLLQGLRQKFKQPIAFFFTKGTISSANLAKFIKKIILDINLCGFTVLSTICDQGPTNMGALRILREASGPFEDGCNNYFKIDGKKVYIVYDIPHLFKSIRNNFLKAGCVVMNGIKGKWQHLVEVENHNRNFLYFSKITQAHVNPKYKSKMRVKLAAQVLSNTVSAVLKLLARAEIGEKCNELNNTANVIEKLDQLFDASNGPSGPHDIKKNKRENVSLRTNHMNIWSEYINILSKTTFITQNGIKLKNVKCVEGYIISLKSLRDMWWTLKALGFKYMNLRNVNQDALENLFGVIRQHSPTNRNPTATHFMAALKTAIVTGLTAPHSRGANCENDNKTLLTDFRNFVFGDGNTLTIDEDDAILPENITTCKENERTPIVTMCEDEFFVIPEEDETSHDFSLLCEQPTVYVAGYLAKKILKKYKCEKCKQDLTVNNPGENPMYMYILLREWWQTKFSLTYPSAKFCETIKTLINITENELLPQIHKPNICLLACTLYEVVCPNSCFLCDIHGKDIKSTCFQITCKLLLRRQCQRINQNLASKEEDLASQNKKAEQQGKAK